MLEMNQGSSVKTNSTNMPSPQVTFPVNRVAFSVKMRVKRAKHPVPASIIQKSRPQQFRRQLPEALPETPGKRAGIIVAHF